jgi:dihydrolipoamide dehydrogenase
MTAADPVVVDPVVADLVVLGGGSGGYSCALRAAELGARVVLIEKDRVGGVCLHRGCIPTKALLHAGEVADNARDASAFGIKAEFVGVDMAGVHAYKDAVVAKAHRGLQGLLRARGVTVVSGTGRLLSPTEIEVTGGTPEADPGAESTSHYAGAHLVLATGAAPRTLPGVTIDGVRVVTSDHALRQSRVPATVVVLGGGVIGVEFASLWRSLGADVTVVEAAQRLLPAEDESSSRRLERAFRGRGINCRTGAGVTAVDHTADGVIVRLADGSTVAGEQVLVAVGRAPVTAGLGLEAAGVTTDDLGRVVVDEFCQTVVPTISAVGDLIASPQLAHVGFGEGILVAERLAGLPVTPIDPLGVPRVTYSEPEVASVGFTAAQARAAGFDIKEFSYDLAGNGKAAILRTAGAVTVVRAVDGPVLGVHLVGSRVGELIAEAQLIYHWEALPEDVAALIHPHPTLSEALGEAHLALAGKPLHVHG